jgi:hypothetical protein
MSRGSAIPDPTIVAPDVWVFHTSSAEMTEVGDGAAALVLTGPPYFSAASEALLSSAFPLETAGSPERIANDILRFAWSLRPVFEETSRILKPGGWAVLQTRDVRIGPRLVQVEAIHRSLLESAGLHLYARYFWRPVFTTAARRRMRVSLGRRYGPLPFDPEVFLAFRKPDAGQAGAGERAIIPDDCAMLGEDFLCTQPGHQPRRHRHHSPIPVLRALISAFSQPGDLVVDPFAGAGTVLRLARNLGRQAIGYEIDGTALEAISLNLGRRAQP